MFQMSSLTSMYSKGGTLPKSNNSMLSIATSFGDVSKGGIGGTSPVEPINPLTIHQSTYIGESSVQIATSKIVTEKRQKKTGRPPSVPRGKGKKVAAIRKNFEKSFSRKLVLTLNSWSIFCACRWQANFFSNVLSAGKIWIVFICKWNNICPFDSNFLCIERVDLMQGCRGNIKRTDSPELIPKI